MDRNNLIFSVDEIFSCYLNNGGKYIIPAYQRGYKWTAEAVCSLLDDVHSFEVGDDDDKRFYCLQNITLVDIPNTENVNVVDGQQRLTTLTVILCYLHHYDSTLVPIKLIEGRIEYDVREVTRQFLSDVMLLDPVIVSHYQDWIQFVADYPQYNYQDIYYLFQAYQTVNCWMLRKIEKYGSTYVSSFAQKLLHHVKLIANRPKISPNEEHELFGNLNTGKVNLDGSDLVRAMLITYVADEETSTIDDDPKRLVQLEERRVRIGLMLDQYARWWSQPEVVDYYRQLLPDPKKDNTAETIRFDTDLYPIDRLYQLYQIVKEGKMTHVGLHFYEHIQERHISYSKMIGELQQLQRLVEYWYDDIELYHLILYVVRYGCNPVMGKSGEKVSIVDIYNKWQCSNRESLVQYLKDCIRCRHAKGIKSESEEYKELNEAYSLCDITNYDIDWYGQHKDDGRLHELFILLDMIVIIQSQSANAIPRLKPSYFRSGKDDIEHIFPQTLISERQPNKSQLFMEYQEIYNTLAKKWNDKNNEKEQMPMSEVKESDLVWDYNKNDNAWQKTAHLSKQIQQIIKINHIGNLCLLLLSVNREYGNDFFDAKRLTILHRMRTGFDDKKKHCFIRPHVLDAFDKAFYGNISVETDMHKWDESDIEARAKDIYDKLNNYLKD